MKALRCLPLVCLAAALTAAEVPSRLPVEYFAREPTTSQARLSPDGKRVAFLRDYNGRTSLHIAEVDKANLTRLDAGEATLANDAQKEVASFRWIGDDRLAITTAVWNSIYGVVAANWDGRQAMPVSGYEDNQISVSGGKLLATEIIHAFQDKDRNILMLDRHEGGGGSPNRPDILKVDTINGHVYTLLKNPGEVARWGLDFNGVARVGILTHGELSGAIYRESEEAPWRTILPLQKRQGQMRPLGFDAAGGRIFVAALTPEKRWAIFPLDPATGSMGPALLQDPEYDIVPEREVGSADLEFSGTILSKKKQTLVGLRYYREAPRVKWFDREFAGYQTAIDHAMPDTMNLFVNSSTDEKRMLWFCFSDQNPGEYYILDNDKHSLKLLAPHMGWVKPAQMAPMMNVKYQARDGLLIHGYITVPAGHELKNLPLIVLVHGGPWARDLWGYDPLIQLLANRGYAVLQMNYRGSTGYGEDLYQQAKREIGGKIQDDIEDATRWAIAAGVANPQQIAIMGASYGGYSTFFGLGHNPELYRCGISLAGVSDWPAIYADSDATQNKLAKKYWREQIGDPTKDMARLQAISPVNFADKITAPVLIIQGKEDTRVPPDQAKHMIAALEKAGRKPESLFLSNMGHSWGDQKQRTEIFKRVVAFLETNLGPGVPVAAPAPVKE